MQTFYFTPVVCSIFFFLFFLAYSQRSQIWCLPYFHTWCDLSANLECRSEMCCTWLAANTGCKNYAKKLPSEHHHTTLSSCIFATQACIDNSKNNLLNSNIFSTSSHNMVNVGTAEIDSGVWGTPANFNEFHVLASLLHRCYAVEVNQTLHDVFGCLLSRYTIYIFGGSCPLTDFCQVL